MVNGSSASVDSSMLIVQSGTSQISKRIDYQLQELTLMQSVDSQTPKVWYNHYKIYCMIQCMMNSSLYESTNNCGMRLACPIIKYHSTPPERLKLVEFYNSKEGQGLYSQRKISVEPKK